MPESPARGQSARPVRATHRRWYIDNALGRISRRADFNLTPEESLLLAISIGQRPDPNRHDRVADAAEFVRSQADAMQRGCDLLHGHVVAGDLGIHDTFACPASKEGPDLKELP